jgi:WD40 repeat protein
VWFVRSDGSNLEGVVEAVRRSVIEWGIRMAGTYPFVSAQESRSGDEGTSLRLRPGSRARRRRQVQSLRRVFVTPGARRQCTQGSPDGGRIVSGSLDETARLWDGVSGAPVASPRSHNERLRDAIFSPDGRRVVTASANRTLRLWDATSGDLVAVLLGHRAEVIGPAFAVRGSLLVSRSKDGETRVWGMDLAERNGILRGHESLVYDVYRPGLVGHFHQSNAKAEIGPAICRWP